MKRFVGDNPSRMPYERSIMTAFAWNVPVLVRSVVSSIVIDDLPVLS